MEPDRPRLLVLASTFPRWMEDTEPRFVESLSYELAKVFDVVVLAPHCRGAQRQETFSRNGRALEAKGFGPVAEYETRVEIQCARLDAIDEGLELDVIVGRLDDERRGAERLISTLSLKELMSLFHFMISPS